jgi:hypothetical protein
LGKTEEVRLFLRDIFPVLHEWMLWFLNSQLTVPSTTTGQPIIFREGLTFAWKGRELDYRRLNSNTLASGLDDYPRSMLPSNEDRHIDLMCWMARVSKIMARAQNLYVSDSTSYSRDVLEDVQRDISGILIKCNIETSGNTTMWDYNALSTHLIQQLELIHWSESDSAYLDIGHHDNDHTIVTEILIRCQDPINKSTIEVGTDAENFGKRTVSCPDSHPKFMYALKGDSGNEFAVIHRVFSEKTALPLVHVRHIGYLSIFPFLLTLLVTILF